MALHKKSPPRVSFNKTLLIPVLVLVGLSYIIISSYMLSGWLMHPVGDDYNSLLAYHIGINWLSILPHTLIHGGGRYGQTLVSVVLYGALGLRSLKLPAFLGIGLFILATYLALLAWQCNARVVLSRKLALGGAVILFPLYSTFSIAFPWIRGQIDNSFQDFLWLPGFVTYTLPLMLTVILVALIVLHRPQLNIWWLITIGLIGLFLGTFNEITPLDYIELLGISIIYRLVVIRFKPSLILAVVKGVVPFLCIAAGLLVGLGLNYVSAATATRRSSLQESGALHQILRQSLHSTYGYLSTYVYGHSAADYRAILLAVVAGMVFGFICLTRLDIARGWDFVRSCTLFCGLSLIMFIASVFTCFLVVFKGYGLDSSTYLTPRFEITYNIWGCLFFLSVGILLVAVISALANTEQLSIIIRFAGPVLALVILLDIPFVLRQASSRTQDVAVFSAGWETENSELQYDASHHISRDTVPVVDIGDAYNIRCTDQANGNDWLGVVKQQYYHIATICADN